MPNSENKTKEALLRDAASKHALRRLVRAELVWEGKYDADGRRVAPLRVALPFQTVETVNESVQERQRGFLFESSAASHAKEWRNRLIWGDKRYVLPSLLAEFAGQVNLIYIDPPFDTGADFSFTATVPEQPDAEDDDSFTFTKEPSIIEHKAYRDTWGRGLDSYLQWFYETAVLLHDIFHATGSLYVHLDTGVSHYVKAILDEVFGEDNFKNEIVWKRSSAHSDSKQGMSQYGRVTDTILFYTRTASWTWNQQFQAYADAYVEAKYWYSNSDGRRFKSTDLTAAKPGGDTDYDWKGKRPPKGRYWAYSRANMEKMEAEGRIHYTTTGFPRLKHYLSEMAGIPLQNLWIDIHIDSQAVERLGYLYQKPEAMLDRIIQTSSKEGDLVLDCFCGSGTTASVAEKLNRRWISCDLGRFSIHTTRKRLLSISNVRPFIVQNLGKYERQLWVGAEFGDGDGRQAAMRQRAYVDFILKLTQATPLNGYAWLHGVKGGRMIHVGAVDAPVSLGDVTQIAAAFKRAIGTGKGAPKTNGVDILGWDFAFELNEVAKQQAAAANIQMRFLRIPRDVMDRRAVEQGEIRFFELAALAVETRIQQREVTLRLTDFVIPPDDVPEEARRAVKHWSQWIDYWAVDWDNKADTFHNEWQTYRTRKDSTLALETKHSYTDADEYTVVVKVIDILGNDTTKTVKVKVR